MSSLLGTLFVLDRKSFGKEAQLPIIDNTPTTKNMPTMGDVRHSLCRHTRQSSTNSGTMLPLTTSWAAFCSLGFCFFARRGEFYCFLYQWELNRFFLTPVTSAAASATAHGCLLPILRWHAYWAHHLRCRTCVICICKNSCCGGCFGRGKLPIKKIGGKKIRDACHGLCQCP